MNDGFYSGLELAQRGMALPVPTNDKHFSERMCLKRARTNLSEDIDRILAKIDSEGRKTVTRVEKLKLESHFKKIKKLDREIDELGPEE